MFASGEYGGTVIGVLLGVIGLYVISTASLIGLW